jgi:PTH1 family peptidyl-tRNA hydrolase
MGTKLIIGLGNPGLAFNNTPHNCGFRVVDSLVPTLYKGGRTVTINNSFTYWLAKYQYAGHTLVLIKPLRYMNLSGTGLFEALKMNGLDKTDLSKDALFIHDELDIESGLIKVVETGNPGNNNGCKNINEVFDLDGKWCRIKVGAKPLVTPKNKVEYVIGNMSKEQADAIAKGEAKAKQAALKWITDGIAPTMAQFNQKGTINEKTPNKAETQTGV